MATFVGGSSRADSAKVVAIRINAHLSVEIFSYLPSSLHERYSCETKNFAIDESRKTKPHPIDKIIAPTGSANAVIRARLTVTGISSKPITLVLLVSMIGAVAETFQPPPGDCRSTADRSGVIFTHGGAGLAPLRRFTSATSSTNAAEIA